MYKQKIADTDIVLSCNNCGYVICSGDFVGYVRQRCSECKTWQTFYIDTDGVSKTVRDPPPLLRASNY